MTNPHQTEPTNIDIRRASVPVIEAFRRGDHVAAARLLEIRRAVERPVVQEALDRYVFAGARRDLDAAEHCSVLQAEPDLSGTLERLRQAGLPPRMPVYDPVPGAPNELEGLTSAQKYDVYASIALTRGTQRAQDALDANESIIIGMRKETSTAASMGPMTQRGTGVYDDQIVVLRQDADGNRHFFAAARASTEPTAQYDHHASPRRRTEDGPFQDVGWRRSEGIDVDGDQLLDLGRLAIGTVEMRRTTHERGSNARPTEAFRPSPEQLGSGRREGGVQRDTNGDSYFNEHDIHGLQPLNATFKIHIGSGQNTDSAGCQTIHPADYQQFIDAAHANPEQTRWQYVLTDTAEPPIQELDHAIDDAAAVPPQASVATPHADRAIAAALAGDSDALDRLSREFVQSTEAGQMMQMSEQLMQQPALQQDPVQARASHQDPARQ